MEKHKIGLCVLLAIIIIIVSSTNVYSSEIDDIDDDKTLAPYFFVEGEDNSYDSFPLKETAVTVNINNIIADIRIVQTYINEGETPINVNYVFPASTRASVHGMKMEIGDKVVTAKIKEREEAKQEFEEAKNEGKSASLLEQQRPNVFTMSVANIMPQDTIRVELHYTELIVATEGVYQFVFPTVVGPRYSNTLESKASITDLWVASPYLKNGESYPEKYDITVNLSAGVPITGLACTSHQVNVTRNGESAAQIKLSDPEDFAGNRDFILEYKLTGQEMSHGLMLNTGEKENFFMLVLQPPERFDIKDIPPREYIFILDVSGSMSGYPLDTAKKLIGNLIANLRETDSFNLVLFSGASYQMSPHSLPATKENIKTAMDLINRQDGGGGTELAPALEQALAIPRDKNVSRSIITITDGYIDGEKAIFDIITENLDQTSFFSFGIGTSVNRYLVDGIAKAGLGESFVVTKPSDADQIAERFRMYIQSPLLTDIHVTYNGFDVYDVEPPHIPTLFAQRPIVLFGKWRGEQSGSIQISGKRGNQDYVSNIQVAEVKPLETNTAISYLWARTKVERLIYYGFNNTDEDAVKQEVTATGLEYSMMTPYTSFIAVIEEVRNPDKNGTEVDQPLPLPLNVSDFAVGGSYMQGAEPNDIILLFLVLAALLIVALYRRRKNGQKAA